MWVSVFGLVCVCVCLGLYVCVYVWACMYVCVCTCVCIGNVCNNWIKHKSVFKKYYFFKLNFYSLIITGHIVVYSCRCIQNHNNDTIKGSKGLLKVLLSERWLEGWTELQHIDPHSYANKSVSFPFSWAAQPGAWGPASLGACSLYRILSPTLTSSLHPGYIIVRHPPSSGRHKSHSIQPVHDQGYILIFLDRMHLLFIQVHFLFWQLGRDLYVTI